MRTLILKNLQKDCPVRMALYRAIVMTLLREHLRLEQFNLGIQLLGSGPMARLNEQYVHHSGPTDVITFGYSTQETNGTNGTNGTDALTLKAGTLLCGDLAICPAVALEQARSFKTSWQSELVRYAVHGMLHLLGYDDLEPVLRRRMKREENRLVKMLGSEFNFELLKRG